MGVNSEHLTPVVKAADHRPIEGAGCHITRATYSIWVKSKSPRDGKT